MLVALMLTAGSSFAAPQSASSPQASVASPIGVPSSTATRASQIDERNPALRSLDNDSLSGQPAYALQQAPESGYVLGSGDLVSIRVLYLDEIKPEPVPIDAEGYIQIPLSGRVFAAGLTPHQLQEALQEKLKIYTENPPDVQVILMGMRQRPVTVVGVEFSRNLPASR